MDIIRRKGTAPGRSRSVEHDGLIWTVATATDKAPSMYRQTESTLEQIDRNLAEAGTSKQRILQATVYIADMARKHEMNQAWLAWVDPDNEPQRACVGTALDSDTLVEIVVLAAR